MFSIPNKGKYQITRISVIRSYPGSPGLSSVQVTHVIIEERKYKDERK